MNNQRSSGNLYILSLLMLYLCFFLITSGCKNEEKKVFKNENVYAKEEIAGFMDVKWGESIDSVKGKMLTRKDSFREFRENYPFALEFMGLSFAGEETEIVRLEFYSKGFYRAIIDIYSDSASQNYFERVKSIIVEKYGEPYKGKESNQCYTYNWRSRDENTIEVNFCKPDKPAESQNFFHRYYYTNGRMKREADIVLLGEMKKVEDEKKRRKQRNSRKIFNMHI